MPASPTMSSSTWPILGSTSARSSASCRPAGPTSSGRPTATTTSLSLRRPRYWFHTLVANRLRHRGAEAHNPYPTFYALNTETAFRRQSTEIGLRVETLRLVEKEPSYGMSSRALFLPLMAYERLVNATELAKNLRSNIFAVLRKGA